MSNSDQSGTGLVAGEPLAPVTLTPGNLELFMYAAAVWLPHRIHYDHDYTTGTEGQAGLLVQGPLQAIHLEQLVREHLPEGYRVTSFTYRHTAPAYVNRPLTNHAQVSEVDDDGDAVTFSAWSEREDGTVTTKGEIQARSKGDESS